jgi:hypothetical protein
MAWVPWKARKPAAKPVHSYLERRRSNGKIHFDRHGAMQFKFCNGHEPQLGQIRTERETLPKSAKPIRNRR